jgi:hypothetical protein
MAQNLLVQDSRSDKDLFLIQETLLENNAIDMTPSSQARFQVVIGHQIGRAQRGARHGALSRALGEVLENGRALKVKTGTRHERMDHDLHAERANEFGGDVVKGWHGIGAELEVVNGGGKIQTRVELANFESCERNSRSN